MKRKSGQRTRPLEQKREQKRRHKQRYAELVAFFTQTYPDLDKPFVQGIAQQALDYEVRAHAGGALAGE
jgi:hypothetical protein